jgi:hypothetical protein
MRLGKKLFKIIRIELESLESKNKFLKKAKRKSEIKKNKNLLKKIECSETTRIKERTLIMDNKEEKEEPTKDALNEKSRKDLKENDNMTIQTDKIQQQVLESSISSQNNTTNINNTEGNLMNDEMGQPLISFRKKLVNQTEVISKNDDLEVLKSKLVRTENDENDNKEKKNIDRVIDLEHEDHKSYSISGSEIDLDGVYNAEENEFIKVMVKISKIIFIHFSFENKITIERSRTQGKIRI